MKRSIQTLKLLAARNGVIPINVVNIYQPVQLSVVKLDNGSSTVIIEDEPLSGHEVVYSQSEYTIKLGGIVEGTRALTFHISSLYNVINTLDGLYNLQMSKDNWKTLNQLLENN